MWWLRAFVLSCISLLLPSTHRQPRRNTEHHQFHLEERNYNNWYLIFQKKRAHRCYKLDGISMGAHVEAPTASSSDVESPNTNSVPELYVTPHILSSGRLAGSPEESNTETQKPHDAIFMWRLALNTSLWIIWVATIIFLQMEANGIWRMRTNTMANQEYRPQRPVESPTKDLHVAECPQTWILQIHLHSLFPNRPWCPQSYLLRLPLQPDQH